MDGLSTISSEIPYLKNYFYLTVYHFFINPMRSGGGGLKAPPPLRFFCPHAFNFGATLLRVRDFQKKI